MTLDESDQLRIVVSNQGVGFDPSAMWEGLDQADGFGLSAVRKQKISDIRSHQYLFPSQIPCPRSQNTGFTLFISGAIQL